MVPPEKYVRSRCNQTAARWQKVYFFCLEVYFLDFLIYFSYFLIQKIYEEIGRAYLLISFSY